MGWWWRGFWCDEVSDGVIGDRRKVGDAGLGICFVATLYTFYYILLH